MYLQKYECLSHCHSYRGGSSWSTHYVGRYERELIMVIGPHLRIIHANERGCARRPGTPNKLFLKNQNLQVGVHTIGRRSILSAGFMCLALLSKRPV